MSDLSQISVSDATAIATPGSVVAQVTDYWSRLRKDGAVPARAAIDARAIAPALPHVFLAEMVTPKVARIRICGHQIEDLLGMDMRGMPVSVLFTADARDQIQDAIAQVTLGARALMTLQGECSFGQPQILGKLALLPLADSTGRITRIMGVLEREGEIGHRPRRFAVARPCIEPAPSPISQPTQAPHLRLIHGGKR